MPEQYRLPYGDAFLVNTHHLDALANHLYTEQRQRELIQQKENQQLDDQMMKEFGKVRSVDTPELVQNYQTYKDLKKKLYFDKNLQRDPTEYNRLQQEANLALQKTYRGINQSQELVNQAKTLTADRFKNPNNYDDNFGNMITEFNRTPMSQLANHGTYGDLSNPDTYRYKGSNTNFQPILKIASGELKPVYSNEEAVDDKGLQTKITPYSFGNSPAQYKQSLLGSLGTHSAGRDAEYLWDQLTDQQRDLVNTQYSNIPAEKWKRMGLNGPQDLEPKNPLSKADQFTSYMAKVYAINNEPKEGTPQFRTNRANVMGQQLKNQKLLEDYKQANRAALINMRHDIKKGDEAAANVWVGSYIDKLDEDATKSAQVYEYKAAGGAATQEKQIPMDAVLAKALKVDKFTPDYLRVTSDGRYRPIFLKRDPNTGAPLEKNGKVEVDAQLSQPISRDQLKLAVSKATESTKQRAATMQGESNPTTSYKINGKSYSHKELLDMGYSEDEIKSAKQKGIIQ